MCPKTHEPSPVGWRRAVPRVRGRGGALSNAAFLDDGALAKLTGRHQKSKQIQWLRSEGIAFRVSATGHPVVTWLAVNGQRETEVRGWRPRALEA
jgi:hypothetical protein